MRDLISLLTNINPFSKMKQRGCLLLTSYTVLKNQNGQILWSCNLKRNDPIRLRICVDYRGLNKLTVIDPFRTPFIDEIINEDVGHDYNSFTDDFSRYNQVPIVEEDQEKVIFVTEFRSFVYKVIPFGLKNALVIFPRIV